MIPLYKIINQESLSKVVPYYYYLYPKKDIGNVNIITSFPITSSNLKFNNSIISANDISLERKILNINMLKML